MTFKERPSVAVFGTGVSGMSAAWLLAPHVDLTVYESADRVGGHANTVTVDLGDRLCAVDTGFIVYNEQTYPNLTALFAHFNVPTDATNMSFAASMRGGSTEYSGESLMGLVAQKANLFRPGFWRMLYDLQRFYRAAPAVLQSELSDEITLGDFLEKFAYGRDFIDDHLLPLSAAIWSAPPNRMLDYPLSAFIRFHENHGLLKFVDRPIWRSVAGGSRIYVERLTAEFTNAIEFNARIDSVRRTDDGVDVIDASGECRRFDHVIFATHADQALRLLSDPSTLERRLLSSFRYSRNVAYLHSDASLMPRRRAVWASWNFIDRSPQDRGLTVTYWMNKLQRLNVDRNLFVTLNPGEEVDASAIHRIESYRHPVMDSAAIKAQRRLWSMQGVDRTWFCGAYFGAGFHEDGLQAGLAVAEELAAREGLRHVQRPWRVPGQSDRIHISPSQNERRERLVA